MTLLTNGNFETGDLTGWTTEDYSNGTGTFTVTADASVKHSGSYSCKIVANSPDSSNCGIGKFYQWLPVTTGQTISFYLKVTAISGIGPEKIYVRFDYVNITGNITAIQDWIKYSHTFTEDEIASLTDSRLNIWVSDQGNAGSITAYIDDCEPSESTTTDDPVASFISDVSYGTSPLTVQFSDTSDFAPTAWVWDFGDAGESLLQNPSCTFTLPAGITEKTYTITLKASNTYGYAYAYKNIVVYSAGTGAVFIIDEPVAPAPVTVTITDLSQNSPITWLWSFGDGGTSTEQNPTHEYTVPGTYTVTLIATGAGGASTYTSYVFVSMDSPTIQVTGDSDPLEIISATVSKSVQEVYWLASVEVVGEYEPPVSTDLARITITVPDHENYGQVIFYGVIANIQYIQTPVGLHTKLTCYDFAYYLACQYVSIKATMSDATTYLTPAQVIHRMLGTTITGSNWSYTTGIENYNIDVVSGWDTTVPKKAWTWTNKTRKWAALAEIADYCDFVFYVFWRYNATWVPCAYFVASADIDTAMDLPDQVVFGDPDPYMVGQLTTVNQDDESVNRVIVNGCPDGSGNTLTATAETAAVTSHEAIPNEYLMEEEAYNTQALVNSTALAALNYLTMPGDIYTATFIQRTDLRLYQSLLLIWYPRVPEVNMRITSITYEIRPVSTMVTAVFTTDRKFTALRKLRKISNPTLWTEVDSLVDSRIGEIMSGKLVAVQSYSSGAGVVKDADGNYFPATGP